MLHPGSLGPPFGNGAVARETQIQIPRWKKLPKLRRKAGRSRSPPYSRRSRRGKQKLSPERWTRSSRSWGECDPRRTQRGQPAARCGGGPPEWGIRHIDTGTIGTGDPAWPRTPRMPGKTAQKEGRLSPGLGGASALPLNLGWEKLTWKTKWLNTFHLWFEWGAMLWQPKLNCTTSWTT